MEHVEIATTRQQVEKEKRKTQMKVTDIVVGREYRKHGSTEGKWNVTTNESISTVSVIEKWKKEVLKIRNNGEVKI